VAEYLQHEYGMERNISELSTALAIPTAMQFVTAPLHIHDMDYYARPAVTNGWKDRMAVIWGEFAMVAGARSLRILPGFGLGSFCNNRFRDLVILHEDEGKPRIKRHLTQMDFSIM
jgi:hypothetical protein